MSLSETKENKGLIRGPVRGRSHVARLNIKMSRVGVYKCLWLFVGFAVTVAIWLREVVSCRNFILGAVATFWAMLLVGIYPGRASDKLDEQFCLPYIFSTWWVKKMQKML